MQYDIANNSVLFAVYSVMNGLPVWSNVTEEYINPGAFQYPESGAPACNCRSKTFPAASTHSTFDMIPILLACLVALAWAEGEDEDLFYPGKCPQFNPVENFDINRYVQGVWYQAYYHGKRKYFPQLHCPEVRLQYEAEGERYIIDKYFLNQSHPTRYSKTKEHIRDHPGSFQFPQSVREEKSEWYYQTIVKVLSTDYDNYSAIWGCYDIEGQDKHREFAIINSRQRSLAPQYYDLVRAYFGEHYPGIDFHAFPWDDCRAICPQPAATTAAS